MENETISKKDLIAPIISIVAFLLLIGGASYAYYSIGTVSNSNVLVRGNITLPARCIASTSKTDCTIAAPTLTQMTPNNASNSTAKTSSAACQVVVTVNGNKNCTCSYIVTVAPVSNALYNFASAVYVTNSISYQITGNATVAETLIPAGWTTSNTVASAQSITVATTGTAVSKSYNMTVKFYNRVTNQDVMANKSYKINFATNTPVCTIPTA